MIKKYLLFITIINIFIIHGQTNINVMFYNLLNYPTAPPVDRPEILKEILNSYEPDLFLVCELESPEAATDILLNSLNEIPKNYLKSNFVYNQSDTSSDSSLQQLVFYNSNFFILENQEEIITTVRDINHYTFILKDEEYLTNPTKFEVYVTHLKSSQGTANQQLRLQMIQEFTNSLTSLNPNSYVMFAGDFNFYTSSEPAYQKIIANDNNIIMKDILNPNNILQSWHNNNNWRNLHTQATRLSNSEFNGHGAYGGLDDRFDFITLSENMLSNSDFYYLNNSYQNYGNNGNCFNLRIDDSDCSGTYSQELRENLYFMSDHLPVTLELTSNLTLNNHNETIDLNLYKILNGNMTSSELKLFIENKLFGEDLQIMNTLGQIIYNTKIRKNNIKINTTSFNKGVYYIKISKNNKNLKFIRI